MHITTHKTATWVERHTTLQHAYNNTQDYNI
jgi:hypothetical protein